MKYLKQLSKAVIITILSSLIVVPLTLRFSNYLCNEKRIVILEGRIISDSLNQEEIKSLHVSIVGESGAFDETDKNGEFSFVFKVPSKRSGSFFDWIQCPECSPDVRYEMHISNKLMTCVHYLDINKNSFTTNKIERSFRFPSKNCLK